VRVLLDECIDWRLSRDIVGHEVKTVGQMSWASIKNGELLALAAVERFDVLVTVDRNLSSQQQVSSLPLAVVILHAKTNRLTDLRHLVPEILTVLESPRLGTATHLGA
jgi:hypothetical protein